MRETICRHRRREEEEEKCFVFCFDLKMSDEIELNDHVLVDDKHPGTVRYKGLVDGHEGLWIGIEWWNQQGKHDGTFQGKVYFQSSKPFSSSFIRPSRISSGRTFSQGIFRQYFQTIDRPSSIVDFSLFGKHLSDYEFDLSRLIRLDLSTQWIRHFDEENQKDLYEKLSQLKELNLRQNLLKFSSDLWKIVEKYFLQLEIFDLSSSRIIFDENPSKEFVEMKELVFIDLDFDLNQFENIFRSFPNLENLHLDKNRLTTISTGFVEQIRNLRRLSLSDNPQLKNWNPSINSLGQLEHLEELVLNNCGIKTIEIVSRADRKEFSRLKYLFLSENLIDDFQSIEELAKIDQLESLSLLRNPLYGSSGENPCETTKQLIIARLPNLIWLNRVFIQRDERRGAEIDYLTFYSKDYFLDCQDFHLKHRQYKRLIDKYGEPNRPNLDQKEKKGLVIRSNLYQIQFEYKNQRTGVKKIPSSMSIAKLKTFLRKIYPNEFDSNDQSFRLLFLIDDKSHQHLNDDYQDLQYYFDQRFSNETSIIRIEKIF